MRSNAVILGMHRSGTSALTGALCQMGWSCGLTASCLEPDDINKKGYFERKDVVTCNEALFIEACRRNLERAHELSRVLREPHMGGHAWFLGPWALACREFVLPAESRSLLEKTVAGMLAEIGTDACFALKDPRLCLTLDYWRPFLPSFRIVSIVRHPLETSRSLERLNKLPRAMNLAAWCVYTLGALRQTRAHDGLLVLQSDLLASPERVLSGILDFLGRTAHHDSKEPEAVRRGSSFLDSGLVHHHGNDDADNHCVATRTYNLLRQGQVLEAERLLACFVDSAVSSEVWAAYCFRLRTFELQHEVHLRDTQLQALRRHPVLGPAIRFIHGFGNSKPAAFREPNAE